MKNEIFYMIYTILLYSTGFCFGYITGYLKKKASIPQPKMGWWVRVGKDKLRCSRCEVLHLIAQYPNGKINWCPNCGAKMETESKEEG